MTLYTAEKTPQNTNMQIRWIPKALCIASHTSELVRPIKNVPDRMFSTALTVKVIQKKTQSKY